MFKRHYYIWPALTEHYHHLCQHSFLKKQKLSVHTYHNVTVLPAQAHNEKGIAFTKGGLVDEQGQYIHNSGLYRNDAHTIAPCVMTGQYEIHDKHLPVIQEPCIYCGLYCTHYGHFLCESTTRLWYVAQHYKKGTKLIFVAEKPVILKGNFKVFFELLGVDLNDLIFVHQPVQCAQIIVPDFASILGGWYTPEFRIPFQKIASSVPPQKNVDKVYLSRGHLKNAHNFIGEENIENFFRQNGYHIIYPEEISLKQLIAYFNGAKFIAGLSGTGLHNIIFANHPVHLIVLSRSEGANRPQELLNQATGVEVSYVDVYYNYLGSQFSAYLLGLTPGIKQLAHHLKYDISGIPPVTAKQVQDYFTVYMQNIGREQMMYIPSKTLNDIWTEIVHQLQLTQKTHRLMTFKYWLFSKLTWGKTKEKFYLRYQNIKEKQ